MSWLLATCRIVEDGEMNELVELAANFVTVTGGIYVVFRFLRRIRITIDDE